MNSRFFDFATNIPKLDQFEGVGFRRWQKKMKFLLAALNVAYVLSTPRPEEQEDETLEATRRRLKWENDDLACRGHILNGMSDTLFDVYQYEESSKDLWDVLEAKYMSEDASSKKFLVSEFNDYKMADNRPVMEQFHEIVRILGQMRQHNMNMDDSIAIASIIDKLPPSWKKSQRTLKHKKEELTMEQLEADLLVEEGIRKRESKNEGSAIVAKASGSVINHVDEGKSSENRKGKKKQGKFVKPSKFKKTGKGKGKASVTCWVCNGPHFKKDCEVWKKRMTHMNGKNSGDHGQGKQDNIINLVYSTENFIAMISEICVMQTDDSWWVDTGATRHVCKDKNLYKIYKSLNDGPSLYMGNDSMVKVKGIGQVELLLTSGKKLTLTDVYHAPDVRKNLVSGIVLNKCGFKLVFEADRFILSKAGTFVGQGFLCNNMFKLNINNIVGSVYTICSSSLWHFRLCHVNYKRLSEMAKDGLIPSFDLNTEQCSACMLNKITRNPFPSINRNSNLLELVHSDLCDFHSTPSLGNKKYIVTFIDDYSRYCYVYLLHSKDEALEKFKIFKLEVELQTSQLVKILRTDRGGEYYDPLFFQSVGIIHETTAPYTPQQNGVAERKNRVLKEMVNCMLSVSGLSEGFWGEAMLTACYILNRVPNKRNRVTPYELWHKRKPNLNYLKVWGCRAVVRLPEPKRKALGEKGIDCIFIGYAEHSKAYRFYVIEPNDFISVHTVIESRDAIFDENRFSSINRTKDLIPSSSGSKVDDQKYDHAVSQEPQLRKSKRARKEKTFGPDFQMYLIEGSRESVETHNLYYFNIEDDPKSFEEAMKSQDIAFWKEAINDEMDSIMGNNTWILTNPPNGCKPIGCKWIFKKKMRVDGTIDKFKARLVAQGFKQKEGVDFFDTYAPVARIATIRLLIAISAIHNLVVHQMDVKTTFLNGELEEEVYMKQPEGFVVAGQENKVCKLIKSLYGLKQAPKQWHDRFDQVVLANGYKINQSDKCIYSKFNNQGQGVIICLYVDDMLIFGTDLEKVKETKNFLSSNFSMKDLGEAEVILGIRIMKVQGGVSLTQSHYIEKVLKRFSHFSGSPVSTPMDPSLKLVPNKGDPVLQLEYSKVIGCLMYAMTSTRPDIAFAIGKMSRYTSNPSAVHWMALKRILKYLNKTINYGLVYSKDISILEGYSDASWISNQEDYSSTSGWVFLLGGGAISWASKKQSCISDSTMASEFIALASACKEADWLRNLILEIPIWPKPMSPVLVHCDSATTLAKAYNTVYNGKSRHIGLRHSYVRELLRNGVVALDFVRSQFNLADPFTKALARDMVLKTSEGIGLKPIISQEMEESSTHA